MVMVVRSGSLNMTAQSTDMITLLCRHPPDTILAIDFDPASVFPLHAPLCDTPPPTVAVDDDFGYAVELVTTRECICYSHWHRVTAAVGVPPLASVVDRKSTRLNSSHLGISYAVFCLK